MRKRQSERIKLRCFQKTIIVHDSSSDQSTTLTKHDECTSTQGKSAHGHDSKLDMQTRSLKLSYACTKL